MSATPETNAPACRRADVRNADGETAGTVYRDADVHDLLQSTWEAAKRKPGEMPVAEAMSYSEEPGQRARIEPVNMRLEGWHGSASELSAMAREVYSHELQGEHVDNASLGHPIVFSSEGKGEAFGARGKMRNPVRAELSRVLREIVRRAVKVDDAPPDVRRAHDTRLFHTLVAPLNVDGHMHAVKVTVREALRSPNSPRHKFYDVTAIEIKRSPDVHGLDGDPSHPAPVEAPTPTISDLARAFNIDHEQPASLRAPGEQSSRLENLGDAETGVQSGRRLPPSVVTAFHRAPEGKLVWSGRSSAASHPGAEAPSVTGQTGKKPTPAAESSADSTAVRDAGETQGESPTPAPSSRIADQTSDTLPRPPGDDAFSEEPADRADTMGHGASGVTQGGEP